MDFLKIFIAAFSATNIMTTFSYIISHHYKTLFKEPVMLNYIFDNLGLAPKGRLKVLSGWLAHYVIGIVMVICYALIWKFTEVKFGWLSGIMLGIISGFVGICAWHLIYMLPDEKPAAPIRKYYLQLFVGHIIFACAVVAAFKLYDYDPLAHISDYSSS